MSLDRKSFPHQEHGNLSTSRPPESMTTPPDAEIVAGDFDFSHDTTTTPGNLDVLMVEAIKNAAALADQEQETDWADGIVCVLHAIGYSADDAADLFARSLTLSQVAKIVGDEEAR